jgi:acetolactate synthase I/II/III large subunit
MHARDRNVRTVGQAVVDQLVIQGVRHVFCVPGESYLPVLDALHDSGITLTVCRNEGGAAMMADAIGRATGSPGVAMVTRGPGASNAMVGVHIAREDSSPMILLCGSVDEGWRDRGAWQEMDFAKTFSGVAKWVAELDHPGRVGEVVARAVSTAMSGRPGPVVIGLPRNVLSQPDRSADSRPVRAVEAGIDADALAEVQARLAGARRPVVIVGGSRWDEASRTALHRFAERWALPVVTSYRRGHLFDADHPNYAGDLGLGVNPKLLARIKAADVILLLGGRLGEVPAQGYQLLDIPAPTTALIHVHADPDEIGQVYQPTLAIPASPRRAAPALAVLEPSASVAWTGEADAAHADYLAWSEVATPQPGEVNLGEVMVWLRERLERDAIVCNGAGGYAAWLHRFFRFRGLNSHIAPASATMGYGVPAAVAMKRLHPERRVVSISGDGDFLMNGQEFATQVQYGLSIVNIVVDNASYGSIRLFQERQFPGRVVATDLKNPDFAAYARAFGGWGATVERTADFAEAFEAASASGLPAILHLKVSTDCALPAMTLSEVRAKALAER